MKLTLGEFYTFFRSLELPEGEQILDHDDLVVMANIHLPPGITIRTESECDGMNTWTMYVFYFESESHRTWFQLKYPMTKL